MQARVIGDFERGSIDFIEMGELFMQEVSAVHHRAKFVQLKNPSVFADALLRKEDRTRRYELDRRGDNREQRRARYHQQNAAADIESALENYPPAWYVTNDLPGRPWDGHLRGRFSARAHAWR